MVLDGGGVVLGAVESGGGVVVDEELSAGGGVAEFDPSPAGGGGGVDCIEDVSPFGELPGAVDCCFEQAASANSEVRQTNMKLRCIDITSLVSLAKVACGAFADSGSVAGGNRPPW